MSAWLSLLGLTTRSDAEEAAALAETWRGTWDVERTRAGWIGYCLTETRAPITARTPAALGTAIAEARRTGRPR